MFQITILVYAWWFVVISMIPVFAILGKSLSEMYFVDVRKLLGGCYHFVASLFDIVVGF